MFSSFNTKMLSDIETIFTFLVLLGTFWDGKIYFAATSIYMSDFSIKFLDVLISIRHSFTNLTTLATFILEYKIGR